MENSAENTERSFTSLLFLFLFVLFAVFVSDNHDTGYHESAAVAFPASLVIENTRGHFDATVNRPVDPLVSQFSIVTPFHIKNPFFLSFQKELSVFNNKIDHLFINLQQENLIVKPLIHRKYLYWCLFRKNTETPPLG